MCTSRYTQREARFKWSRSWSSCVCKFFSSILIRRLFSYCKIDYFQRNNMTSTAVDQRWCFVGHLWIKLKRPDIIQANFFFFICLCQLWDWTEVQVKKLWKMERQGVPVEMLGLLSQRPRKKSRYNYRWSNRRHRHRTQNKIRPWE